MRSTRPLLTWDRTPGFLCDWHIAGLFDPGLNHNSDPVLFQEKVSHKWRDEHLASWGGAASIKEVPPLGADGLDWPWLPLPVNGFPQMSLLDARGEYQAWAERMAGMHPDSWDRMYYALAVVESSDDLDAALLFSGWDGCRLWVNGDLCFEEHSYHHVIWDMERVPFQLRRGDNTFLFQLDRDGCVARIAVPAAPEKVASLRSVACGDAPTPRKVSTFAQMRHYAGTLSVQMPFNDNQSFADWQDQFRAHYHKCLGPAPMRPEALPVPDLKSEESGDGYMRKRYHLKAEGDAEIPLYVLLPERPNGRTLMVLHGHETPDRVVGAVSYRGPENSFGGYRGNYGEMLAQRGFVVGMIHERAFGERRDYFGKYDPCNVGADLAACVGLTWPRLHIADIHLACDFLETLDAVDGKRMGVTGLSGGGTLTYLTAAFDELFAAAGVFCGMCRYTQYAMRSAGCGMQVVPGVFPTGDVGEILSLIAPRPLLLVHGRLDSSFNGVEFASIADDARRAYRAADAEDRLTAEILEIPHQFNVDAAERFFLKWL